jgi:hypothetical protein
MATTTTEHIRNRVLGNHPAVALSGSPSLLNDFAVPPADAFLLSATTGSEEQPCLDPPGKIRSNLYIGSKEAEGCLGALQAAGITHILQAGGELRPSFPGQFEYKHLSVSDEEDEDLVEAFKEAFAFIDEGRKKGGWCVVALKSPAVVWRHPPHVAAAASLGLLQTGPGCTYRTLLHHC